MSATTLSSSNSFLRRRSTQFLQVAFVSLAVALFFRGAYMWENFGVESFPAFAPIEETATQQVAILKDQVAQAPQDANVHVQLGIALLTEVRATGDPAGYADAKVALNRALELEPNYVDAMVGLGTLALAEHNFEVALEWGEKAKALNPFRAEALGIMTDSQVELGRYDEALASAQAMISLRPNLESYSRVSYQRELHGDLTGAVEAMQLAYNAGVPGTEARLWAGYQLGELYYKQGELREADKVFDSLLAQQPTYAYAHAGKAQILTIRGYHNAAIERYESVIERVRMPEFLTALGHLYMDKGETEKADALFSEVRLDYSDDLANGMNEQLEAAMFESTYSSDHARILELAQQAYDLRPTIFAADTLAWALYNVGEYEAAWAHSQEAMRLNTLNPSFYYHAGMIAEALGKEVEAKTYLDKAEEINHIKWHAH